MKYALYVYKRIAGQEYYCSVGQGQLEEMRKLKKAQLTGPQLSRQKYLHSSILAQMELYVKEA